MLTPVSAPRPIPDSLRKHWITVSVCEALVILAVAIWMRGAWSPAYAGRWAPMAGAASAFQLVILRRYLHENTGRHGSTVIRASLGPGNLLTLLRGLCVALMAGFLFLPQADGLIGWLPALLFTSAALMDLFDGYLARKTGSASRLGEILDVEFDALGVLLVSALAVWFGNLPWWFLLLAAARYWFMWGQTARAGRGLPIASLPESRFRRPVAGTFMAFLTVMLWPPVHPPGTYLAAAVYSLPYVLIFVRDWLVVTRAVEPHAPSYRRVWGRAARFAAESLPLLLRGAVLLAVAFGASTSRGPDWGEFVASLGGAMPAALAPWLNGVVLLAAVLVTTGVVTHFTAVPVIAAAAVDILTAGLDPWNGLLLASACAVTLLGGGRFTLWEPESERLFRRRLGDDRTET